jgi:hypothetical protein
VWVLYPHRIHAVAGYAVDGNTDGEFLNSSTTSTKDEQGAWWQVAFTAFSLFKDQHP